MRNEFYGIRNRYSYDFFSTVNFTQGQDVIENLASDSDSLLDFPALLERLTPKSSGLSFMTRITMSLLTRTSAY